MRGGNDGKCQSHASEHRQTVPQERTVDGQHATVTPATDTRLAVIISAAVKLKAQLCELHELRERVKKELASPRKSPQPELPSARSERCADHFP